MQEKSIQQIQHHDQQQQQQQQQQLSPEVVVAAVDDGVAAVDNPGRYNQPNQPPRRRHAEVPRRVTYGMAMRNNVNYESETMFSLGTPNVCHKMTEYCRFCLAEFFAKETKSRAGDYNLCCRFGQVNVPYLRVAPRELRELFTGNDHLDVNFRRKIRMVNSLFAMASFKTTVPGDRNVGLGSWCFNVCGQIHHYTRPIPADNPQRNDIISHNQYYFIDAEEAINRRCTSDIGKILGIVTVRLLEKTLRRENPFIRSYVRMSTIIRDIRQGRVQNTAGQVNDSMPPRQLVLAFKNQMMEHIRNFDVSAADMTDVAAVFVGEEPPFQCNLVIHERDDGPYRRAHELRNLNPLADPMVYPIIFPKGELGYQTNVPYVVSRVSIENKNQTFIITPPIVVSRQPRVNNNNRRGNNNDNVHLVNDNGAEIGMGGFDVVIDEYDGGDNTPAEDVDGNNLQANHQRRFQFVTMKEFYRHRLMVRSYRLTNSNRQQLSAANDDDDDIDRDIDDGNVDVSAPDLRVARVHFSLLHFCGKLFQQYVVNAWVRVENNNLWYLRQIQRRLRSASLPSIRRMLERRAQQVNARIGKVVILPASFIGGPRYLQRRYLDALTLVARHGKPSLFITMTCNPSWPEIRQSLPPTQKWENRPDLVCRVFYAKLKEMIDDLTNKQYFGVSLNYMYTVEFQKRGLPHAHILLTLRSEDRLDTEENVDAAVCAELPDIHREPRLYEIVVRHYLHGPCGPLNPEAPCTTDGACDKFFPKSFREHTDLSSDNNRLGQPEYRRRDDGRSVVINGHLLDNRHVVPYNKFLAVKYDCHINVEVCGSLMFIRYLYKYVEKGSNYFREQTSETVDVGHSQNASDPRRQQRVIDWDEIHQYQGYRYVSATEAAWKLFDFAVGGRSHSVFVLPVHCENEQEILFDESDDADDIRRNFDRQTKLTAWFDLNCRDPQARQFKYDEVPEHYTWDNKNSKWAARKKISKVIGTICEVSPYDQNRFYLRKLLLHVRGARSFGDLRTINGTIFDDYINACRALGLLVKDDEYRRCLEEVVLKRCPFRLRQLFGLLACLIMTNSADSEYIVDLWRTFKNDAVTDFVQQGYDAEEAERMALFHIKHVIGTCTMAGDIYTLADMGLDHFNIDANDGILIGNVVLTIDEFRLNRGKGVRDLLDNIDASNAQGNIDNAIAGGQGLGAGTGFDARILATLNIDQNAVYEAVMTAIVRSEREGFLRDGGNLFFVDGPAGTGKTYLYNIILSAVQTTVGREGLAVAWTGIAATLLRKGMTVHSAFKLPLTLTERTVAGHPIESEESQIIKRIPIILWDEASMSPKYAVDAIDWYLRDLMNLPGVPMGGKIVVFGGDFRQLLPVVPNAAREQVIRSSIREAIIWRHVQIYQLTENLRIMSRRNGGSPVDNFDFSDFLIRLGDGSLPNVRMPEPNSPIDLIEIPRECLVSNKDTLIDSIYGPAPIAVDGATLIDNNDRIEDMIRDGVSFPDGGRETTLDNEHNLSASAMNIANKAILCPTNLSADNINDMILNRLSGQAPVTYFSVDEFVRRNRINREGENNDYDNGSKIPDDILHSLNVSGLPPHELRLKPGCVVMLLRNIDIPSGLCNGTRLLVLELGDHVLKVQILTGGFDAHRGSIVYLPRITLEVDEHQTSLPGTMYRVQFPVKLSFAMTIDKAQGQTFDSVGVCLDSPCFAHGQLYVAFSRVGSVSDLRVFVENSSKQGRFYYRGGRMFTRNIVYKSIITGSRVLDNNARDQQQPSPIPVSTPQDNVYYDLSDFEDVNFDELNDISG